MSMSSARRTVAPVPGRSSRDTERGGSGPKHRTHPYVIYSPSFGAKLGIALSRICVLESLRQLGRHVGTGRDVGYVSIPRVKRAT